MRAAVDTGGTFTDLIVEDDDGALLQYKSSSTPREPIAGVLDVLGLAAADRGVAIEDLVSELSSFIHGTTRPINAVLTGATAPTALLVTAGHPDILRLREGGRMEPFNHTRTYPEPYVPRRLTFEVPERVAASGEVIEPLDEEALREVFNEVANSGVDAVGVCLLWSTANPVHELRVGAIARERLPGVALTLSHQLNPIVREYRRASSTVLDASLKPVMGDYFRTLENSLRDLGFGGRLLIVTSGGGLLDAADVAAAPIHAIGSGPAMAPIAGRIYSRRDGGADTAIVADAGGTSYEVSLIRDGEIPWTKETWIGRPFEGHLTGFPSVDVKSIGAGGGSIASVDEGGMLHVGPRSAGAEPGPACYGRGGSEATLTDAALILGYIDHENFLGGSMRLNLERAQTVLKETVADPLGIDVLHAAAAVLRLGTERMVTAIEQITVDQGVDPDRATLVAGGGASGLNAVAVARQLGIERVLIPDTGATLNAAGALLSDLTADRRASVWTNTSSFDAVAVNAALEDVASGCEEFVARQGAEGGKATISFFAEARYPSQVWDLEVPIDSASFSGPEDVAKLRGSFHELHRRVFGVADVDSEVELTAVRARAVIQLDRVKDSRVRLADAEPTGSGSREVFFAGEGSLEARVVMIADLDAGDTVVGPAVIESPVTSVVLDPGASAQLTELGTLLIDTNTAGVGDSADGASEPHGVQLAVLGNRFESVVRSMTNTLLRTGRSGVLNTARDFSCCILTRENELLAMAESLPIHVMSGPDLMAGVMREHHPQLRRGDAFLHNSPYHGNSHAADHSILIPVIDEEGRHHFTVLAKAHQADCGNSAPTTYMTWARDVYEEGALIFPCVKVQSGYEDCADIVRMQEMRIRVPDQWWGDYLALLGAARIGERRLLELGAEIGWDRLHEYGGRWLDYSEERMSAAISTLPAGMATAETTHDPVPGAPDGVPIQVSLEIDPEQGSVRVDLRDNPDCLENGLNLTEATSRTAAMLGVFNGIHTAVPPNAGSFRRIDVQLRENCVTGIPRHPASCSAATTNVLDRTTNAVQRALAGLGDGVGLAEFGYPFPPSAAVISGKDPRTGEAYVNQIFLGFTCGGASPMADGWLTAGGAADGGVLQRDSVEIDELKHPILIATQRIEPDSEGAGRTVGAPGARVEYRPLGCALRAVYGSDGTILPAAGVRGGGAGGAAQQYKRDVAGELQALEPFADVVVEDGESLVSVCCGGGGYGSPLDRDPARVEADLREGLISEERAREVYGVVFEGETVAAAATEQLRRELRKELT